MKGKYFVSGDRITRQIRVLHVDESHTYPPASRLRRCQSDALADYIDDLLKLLERAYKLLDGYSGKSTTTFAFRGEMKGVAVPLSFYRHNHTITIEHTYHDIKWKPKTKGTENV